MEWLAFSDQIIKKYDAAARRSTTLLDNAPSHYVRPLSNDDDKLVVMRSATLAASAYVLNSVEDKQALLLIKSYCIQFVRSNSTSDDTKILSAVAIITVYYSHDQNLIMSMAIHLASTGVYTTISLFLEGFWRYTQANEMKTYDDYKNMCVYTLAMMNYTPMKSSDIDLLAAHHPKCLSA